MNKIQKARGMMKQKLEQDEELRYGYQSNIAMLLHDRFDLPDFRERNEAANDILKLIFEVEGDFVDWRCKEDTLKIASIPIPISIPIEDRFEILDL